MNALQSLPVKEEGVLSVVDGRQVVDVLGAVPELIDAAKFAEQVLSDPKRGRTLTKDSQAEAIARKEE